MTQPPRFLNGHPVLHHAPLDDDGTFIILCYRPRETERFVVATWSRHNANEWSWGHYFSDLMTAVDYFRHRPARV